MEFSLSSVMAKFIKKVSVPSTMYKRSIGTSELSHGPIGGALTMLCLPITSLYHLQVSKTDGCVLPSGSVPVDAWFKNSWMVFSSIICSITKKFRQSRSDGIAACISSRFRQSKSSAASIMLSISRVSLPSLSFELGQNQPCRGSLSSSFAWSIYAKLYTVLETEPDGLLQVTTNGRGVPLLTRDGFLPS
jgi:hypothetical protein